MSISIRYLWNRAALLAVGCSVDSLPKPAEVDGMVYIPAGEFWRGCDPVAVEEWSGGSGQCEDDPDAFIALDVPMRSIYLSEYWIDKHEATLGEYLACYDAGVCPGIGTVVPENIPEEDRNRLPINGLNWFEAETYCAWRGKRLPTEAEWEKAARGTDQRQLPWGDDYSTCGWANLGLGGSNNPCPEEGRSSGRIPEGRIALWGDWHGRKRSGVGRGLEGKALLLDRPDDRSHRTRRGRDGQAVQDLAWWLLRYRSPRISADASSLVGSGGPPARPLGGSLCQLRPRVR